MCAQCVLGREEGRCESMRYPREYRMGIINEGIHLLTVASKIINYYYGSFIKKNLLRIYERFTMDNYFLTDIEKVELSNFTNDFCSFLMILVVQYNKMIRSCKFEACSTMSCTYLAKIYTIKH